MGMKLLLAGLVTMFLQQVVASLGRNLPPLIAPAILEDLAWDPALVGVYVGVAAVGSLMFQLGCGGFIVRYGALRMSQVSLLTVAVGLAAGAAGNLLLFAISAIIGGGGAALSTPASSHLLGRLSPARLAPLVFSLKQTAVPAGLLLCGLIGPLFVGLWGWRGAMLAGALICFAAAVALEPFRRVFDADRAPGRPFSMADVAVTLRVATQIPALRDLSIACFAFNGLQVAFVGYFVTYLTSLGQDLVAAGAIFSAAMLIAIPGRVVWGWAGSTIASPASVLGWLALGMAGSAAVLVMSGPGWSALALGAVATALSATVLSWHGVLLAEAARHAPEGLRGFATGGVLSCGQFGGLVMPLVYAAALGLGAGHGVGFLLVGLPCAAVGIMLLRRAGRDRRSAGAG